MKIFNIEIKRVPFDENSTWFQVKRIKGKTRIVHAYPLIRALIIFKFPSYSPFNKKKFKNIFK